MAALVAKEARGYILKVLKVSHPRPVGDHVISTCLTDAGLISSPGEILGYFDYLEEKGYLKKESTGIQEMGERRCRLCLTAQGIDLLEETIVDLGVIV